MNEERGGILAFFEDEPVAVEATCAPSSHLMRSLPILFDTISAPADDFLVDRSENASGDININAANAALRWLKLELSQGDSSPFIAYSSAWRAIDMVCELHTVVDHQPTWTRMWRASRDFARVVNQPLIPPETDGTCRIFEQITRYAELCGRSDVPVSDIIEYFVVPTPAVGLLVLILAASRQTLRRVLGLDEREAARICRV